MICCTYSCIIPNKTLIQKLNHKAYLVFTFFFLLFLTEIPNGNGILLPKLFWPIVRKNVLVIQKKTFSKFLRSLWQFIQVVKGQNNFGQQNAFLTCSWRFLTSYKLEYRIVASTNMCYYSENQVFGGVTIWVLCSKRGCY